MERTTAVSDDAWACVLAAGGCVWWTMMFVFAAYGLRANEDSEAEGSQGPTQEGEANP